MSETHEISLQLERRPTSKWGFVVYRCTYESDADWVHFMHVLNERVRNSLRYEDAEAMMDRLDWAVQEDRALEEVGTEEVRRRFRAWLASGAEPNVGTPRFHFCVMVNKECLESVLNGPPPEKPDLRAKSYVYFIDEVFGKDTDGDEDDVDETEDEDENRDLNEDGGGGIKEVDYEPIEGCAKYDVGWMKLCLANLCPRAYNIMEGYAWEAHYVRPPKVAKP